jgi:hydrogenase maturation protein HypF
MLVRGVRCPPTTSAGRWFDAVAALLGVREVAAFEGQAAMLLEGLAAHHGVVAPAPALIRRDGDVLDAAPLFAAMADAGDRAAAAALFHATLGHALAAWAADAARSRGVDAVALGGGCFLNAVLSQSVATQLAARGLAVLEAEAAPPSDGGLALGQAWIGRRLVESC